MFYMNGFSINNLLIKYPYMTNNLHSNNNPLNSIMKFLFNGQLYLHT